MRISIIAAIANNGVIGNHGELPWELPSDLKRFKILTQGKTVIAGRKTHESIIRRLGHPLVDRRTIVVTRDPRYSSECEVAHSLNEALARAENDPEVFIIGGAEIYKEALLIADRLYITHILARPEGDVYFPPWTRDEWVRAAGDVGSAGIVEHNNLPTTFCIYERKPQPMNLEYARHDDQRAVMEDLQRRNICNFCPEHRHESKPVIAIWEGKSWIAAHNNWPYGFTRLHLLAIPNRHVTMLGELTTEEWLELYELLNWAIKHHELEAGAIGLRFGTMHLSGATVAHLHAHLIVADPNTTKEGYERVRFPMGPKPHGE